jgi:hypothetical protein
MDEIEVIAHKSSMAKFKVKARTREEAEKAIHDKLRSNKELIWKDYDTGINVVCFYDDIVWRTRRRFLTTYHEEE